MPLKKLQREFIEAIKYPEKADNFSRRLRADHGVSAVERLSVYRNNVWVGLTEALRSTFPLCEKLMGVQTFQEVADCFIRQQFPIEACLHAYGADFPAFIKTLPSLMEPIPYLADIASYEWVCHASYHAENEGTVSPERLESIAEKDFFEYPLILCQHAHCLTSEFPLKEIAEFIKEQKDQEMTYHQGRHFFLVYRAHGTVCEEEISSLFYGGLYFLRKAENETLHPKTVSLLTQEFVDKGHAQDLGAFMYFVFNRGLIVSPRVA
jgi:hypothetical protein